MHQRQQVYDERQIQLERDVNHLQTENLKLNSDVKVIRAEHSELL